MHDKGHSRVQTQDVHDNTSVYEGLDNEIANDTKVGLGKAPQS